MKKCPKCGFEVEDNFLFCPKCGAEFAQTKKKLSFLEKRELKEQEQKELMQKSYISLEQVENAKEIDCENLYVVKKAPLDKTKKAALARVVVAVVVVLVALAGAFVASNYNIDKNLKLVTIFSAFIVIFASASIFISDLHLYLTLNKMQQSTFAVKKIKYGKPPIVNANGCLYEILVQSKCGECFNDMHIEEVDGRFVAVCNVDRNHVYKIDFEKVHDKFFATDK